MQNYRVFGDLCDIAENHWRDLTTILENILDANEKS